MYTYVADGWFCTCCCLISAVNSGIVTVLLSMPDVASSAADVLVACVSEAVTGIYSGRYLATAGLKYTTLTDKSNTKTATPTPIYTYPIPLLPLLLDCITYGVYGLT